MKYGKVNNSQNDELSKYRNAIFEYEKRVESLSKSKTTKEEIGYLVYYDDYIELKSVLNCHKKWYNQKANIKVNTINKLEPIDIKSANYLKDIIINIKCVLVTEELFELLSNKNKKDISFLVDNQNLTLILRDKEKMKLIHKKFILDDITFDLNEPGLRDVKNILDAIWNYFSCENGIINGLKNNSTNQGHGYLVSKSWIDKWKNYSNYEYIKNKYLLKNINIKENQNLIYKEIIDYKEKYKITIPETDIISIKDKEDLKSNLEKEPLGFIDSLFLKYCPFIRQKSKNTRYSWYNMSNGILEFTFSGKKPIHFKCNNNIISYDKIIEEEDRTSEINEKNEINEINEISEDLKQLIKIYIFQKYLLDKNYKNPKGNILFKEIVLINTNKIQKYKESFEYEKLAPILDKITINYYLCYIF